MAVIAHLVRRLGVLRRCGCNKSGKKDDAKAQIQVRHAESNEEGGMEKISASLVHNGQIPKFEILGQSGTTQHIKDNL